MLAVVPAMFSMKPCSVSFSDGWKIMAPQLTLETVPAFLSELKTELITLSRADLGAFWETID